MMLALLVPGALKPALAAKTAHFAKSPPSACEQPARPRNSGLGASSSAQSSSMRYRAALIPFTVYGMSL
eukprot:scaffold376999_cov23-Prasinocladus_malaysianus.AAC.1